MELSFGRNETARQLSKPSVTRLVHSAEWRDSLIRLKLVAGSTLPACPMGEDDNNCGVFVNIERGASHE